MYPKFTLSTRSLILATVFVVFGAAIGTRAEEIERYSSEFDDLDVQAILTNDAERDRYYACFMDTGPCHTPAAEFFKSKAAEAVVTSCKYCTDRQLEMFEQIVTWFMDNKPRDWDVLIEKQIENARKLGLHPH